MAKLLVPLPAAEWEAFSKTHRQIFLHNPRPGRDGTLCTHPMHNRIAQAMLQPGVDLEIPFDAGEQASYPTDDELDGDRFRG